MKVLMSLLVEGVKREAIHLYLLYIVEITEISAFFLFNTFLDLLIWFIVTRLCFCSATRSPYWFLLIFMDLVVFCNCIFIFHGEGEIDIP